MLERFNPVHHTRKHPRLATAFAAVGIATASAVGGAATGLEGCVGGKCGAISLGRGAAHEQETKTTTTTVGINDIGLNFSGMAGDSSAALGGFINHAGPSKYEIIIKEK